MIGTFRTFSQQVREVIMKELEAACSVARALGGDYTIKYYLGYPTTVNDPEMAGIMLSTAIDLLGKDNVVEIAPRTWSEDFSFFANQVPAAFMFLGVAIDGDLRSHHSPDFDIDESGLYVGAAVLSETARRLISRS
jgi:amidohydrolase